jgi:hypothetical protein
MSENGKADTFPTLEAACRDAQDGAVVVLNYDGQRVARPERRLRIENKRLTIRAGRRANGTLYRPLVVFEGTSRTSDAESRLITLVGGTIKLINLDLQVTVRDQSEADEWALFSFIGPNRVRMQGTRVTFINPAGRPATVFELNPGSRLDDMKTMPGTTSTMRLDLEIELVESVVRGGCDLVAVRDTAAGRFKLEDSLVAIRGTVVSVVGNHDMPKDSAELELSMDHVTCVMGNGLVKMDSGDESRELVPLVATAANCVFANTADSPLVLMTGNTSTQDFTKRLRWTGERNAYYGFEKLWTVRPTSLTSSFDEYRFSDWLSFWKSETEVKVSRDDPFWQSNGWSSKDLAEVTGQDFLLDEAHEHPVIAEGTDGENIGADLTALDFLLSPKQTGEFDGGIDN